MLTSMDKQSSTYRLSSEGKRLLKALAQKMGIAQASVLEVLIRERAEREGVQKEGANGR